MELKFPGEYNFSPPAWVLPHEAIELKNYIERKKTLSMIVKPEGASQGKGIFITKSLEDINLAKH